MGEVAKWFWMGRCLQSLSFYCWMKKGTLWRSALRLASSQLKVDEKENLLFFISFKSIN